MKFTIEPNELYYEDDKIRNKTVQITYPNHKLGVVNINYVFVDHKYRGQGIATEAMNQLYEYLKEHQIKVIATCSYALKWFDKNPDKQNILMKEHQIRGDNDV